MSKSLFFSLAIFLFASSSQVDTATSFSITPEQGFFLQLGAFFFIGLGAFIKNKDAKNSLLLAGFSAYVTNLLVHQASSSEKFNKLLEQIVHTNNSVISILGGEVFQQRPQTYLDLAPGIARHKYFTTAIARDWKATQRLIERIDDLSRVEQFFLLKIQKYLDDLRAVVQVELIRNTTCGGAA